MVEQAHYRINWTVPWGRQIADQSARSVKSAERTVALFELFALHQRSLTIGQIAAMLDAPQPSVTMLVRNLVRLGYIEHDRSTKTYIPTIRIMLLGSWIHRRFNADSDLEAALDELIREAGETVLVGIQNGMFSQYVSAQMAAYPSRMEVQSGMLRPLTCTAVGRLLLSLKTDAEIGLLVRRCNAAVTDDRLRVSPGKFMDVIARTRAQGFGETCGDIRPGHSVIAVTLPCPVGSIPLAIAVGGPTEHMIRKRSLIIAGLRRAQARLASHAVGSISGLSNPPSAVAPDTALSSAEFAGRRRGSDSERFCVATTGSGRSDNLDAASLCAPCW
ncbi:IclR family transcriptional regulator [Tardiphaga sp. 215_C5_N2_1]|uniref:IclR family transcriptional regulator n=1 Tax=Tardiphaga sp. 215_C5_N2_1 TaxID=3240774 RepID=UPI003F8B2A7E